MVGKRARKDDGQFQGDDPSTPHVNEAYQPVEVGATRTEAIARVCHDANRAYCATIGDYTQPAWDDAPQWHKQSVRRGVVFVIQNPDAPPSASHEGWLAQKDKDGWVYGPVKDVVAKTHPCMVPYDELPDEQRRKDALFMAVARALA